MPACCSWNDVFQYETNKVTRIQSVNYGTIKWILHMTVFSYVSFALMSDKLYQRKEPLISSVHTKVKGVAEVTENVTEGGVTKLVHGIFDTADYTLPLQGNSFFVMTNYLKSEGQEQKLCPEYPSRGKQCHSDQGCIKGWMDPQSKGIQTGRCIPYDQKRKTCEIFAWCPAEEGKEAPRPALLRSAENFTVLIKNNIDFPGHNYTTRNILPGMNISCTFHKTWNPQCPIFRLGDIFQEIGENFTEVAVQGGIMGIEIYWDCNLDSWSHRCQPKYSFRRLDDKYTNESLFPGYNFRYAKYYKENGMEKRTLIKAFGVRFDILVFGTGGKFDIIQLVVYIGSTLSYFGLATVCIDLIINTYASTCCRSRVYPSCKCCEPCAVNEYYYRKKCEPIVEPKPTLKYVSFVDEPHIWMVDQQLLGKSLQDVKGQEVPRPQTDFLELSRLSLSLHHSPPIPGQPEEMQLLQIEAVPRSRDSPDWCQCGNCLPSQLPENRRALEELCCRRKPGQCITTSELFSKIVLSREALQLLLLYQEPLLALEGEAINSKLRHCAYRSYATWRFVSQDMADFAILPSCCRWKIRKEFPKTQGQYSGFKYPY
ncbi:purinergic receptor P2X, ligand-gated ion channel, 7, isoform CRA_a [Rattus norvegicus]|uniref:P2X purinoceptor 7 n=3 Tax=Rattus norvegicus TaxID=10116 RepID=P2RX7_RAT|nr:P2X purinoceptor 7 [Rattus norvegicus]Q64663.1 RecName: Full=P2X purinoceptor 7; Short=P2X7; AltName: Full=ATP receptor; AltName: Full=P2Z receptor; AltName: Full=Purinergic receptor [Rattus norvegicus]EDM13673.1 purinergic receptor P2X, ligand-gated ion channel, 7, isoform CRA_a [Rattus norvegicus]CAA65131.1 P2X7 [Rattus norvegicus]|eukprot:NP_062129.1 P2X purinoceptor 7 [Rattus norvegicus]